MNIIIIVFSIFFNIIRENVLGKRLEEIGIGEGEKVWIFLGNLGRGFGRGVLLLLYS